MPRRPGRMPARRRTPSTAGSSDRRRTGEAGTGPGRPSKAVVRRRRPRTRPKPGGRNREWTGRAARHAGTRTALHLLRCSHRPLSLLQHRAPRLPEAGSLVMIPQLLSPGSAVGEGQGDLLLRIGSPQCRMIGNVIRSRVIDGGHHVLRGSELVAQTCVTLVASIYLCRT